jgi:hypothetical protein
MGRGRQKAKHTKVARELKYFSPSVDLTALERELAASAENELVDKWADLYPDEDEAESTDGETGETVAEIEDVIETEEVDEVRDQLGDVDDDGLENKD